MSESACHKALAIAKRVHKDQLDKSGKLYTSLPCLFHQKTG